jgi:hypothetical protein
MAMSGPIILHSRAVPARFATAVDSSGAGGENTSGLTSDLGVEAPNDELINPEFHNVDQQVGHQTDAKPVDAKPVDPAVPPSGLKPRRTPGDPYRVSNLGIAAATATGIYLLAASLVGTQLSGLLGSNVFSAVFVVLLVVTLVTLAAAVVLDVLLGRRGGPSSNSAMILGLMLLLPPTGVIFYLVNRSLQG